MSPRFSMLEIDLTSGSSKKTDVTETFDKYLGGTGVGTALMRQAAGPSDPFDPASQVLFCTGPFSSVYPVATKTVAMFPSALTGNLGESHAGGRLALSMYGAGIHVLKITGKSPIPVYVTIEGDNVAIHPANSLKGMSALATERVLRDRVLSPFKRSIVRIGPAGERLSPIACATVDASRHFGRLGLGAVLGSKNCKAIVVSGGNAWRIEKRAAFNRFYKKLYDTVVRSEAMKKYHDLGTPMNILNLNAKNGLPTRNFSQGYFEGAPRISGEAFAEDFLAQQIACAHCQVGCIHMATLREAFDASEHMFKISKVSYDYELIFALGSNLSIQDPQDILKLLVQVEKQGWDAMSMGGVLAWATEAFQKGIIDESHTGGLVLNFGDAEAYLQALSRIKKGEGEFFRDLEKGSAFCSEKYGGKDLAIVFGRNEAPGYMTGLYGFLGFATGFRHSHLDSGGYSIDQKIAGTSFDPEQKTKELYEEAKWRMVLNSLVVCLFARNVYTREVIQEGLETIGMEGWDPSRLDDVARTIHNQKTLLKREMGFHQEEVALPGKLTRVMTTGGKIKNEEFERQRQLYEQLVEQDLQKG
ncbi:MAG TPA: aldehyde ferredoxin oxidoreductase C-terminal domain-containing protein [Thermotogota bacterium]|nr:aldehyde ferredoxin oxidoreductase C-terminal domain-containing protein [Thermotogota bacterium]HRW92076.1 aldehyde ferredoxin oxidoreductase C-terminal domain-containing protein [Thermotogota bacterium]